MFQWETKIYQEIQYNIWTTLHQILCSKYLYQKYAEKNLLPARVLHKHIQIYESFVTLQQ